MIKKILTLVLAVSMLVMPVAAAGLTDIAGNAYEKEITFLNAIGIVEGRSGSEYAPDEALTRAEMVTIVLRLLNIEGAQPTTFVDAKDHWASNAIGTAASMGIVNGVNATHFSPDGKLTYPQAVKMLVCALGYDVQAQALGGYPSGYLAKASQLGILDGTSDKGDVNRAQMAKLVANAVEVNVAVRTGFGDDLTFTEKGTLLKENLRIHKITAKITGNEVSSVAGPTAKAGYVVLGETTPMLVGTTDAASRLGEEVTVYARLEDDEYTILHMVAKKDTKVVTLDADDLTTSSTTTKICYIEDGMKEEIPVAAGAAWFVNGVKKTADAGDLAIDMGTVELVVDGDTATTVRIKSYKTLIVDTVRPDNYTITFKNGVAESTATLVLDPAAFKSIDFKSADGKEMKLDALVEWDVLSVSQSATSIEIIKNGKKVNGKVSEMSTEVVNIDGTDYTVPTEVVIDGTTYDVAPCVARGIASGEIGAIGIDTEAAFLLDFAGNIVGFDGEAYRDFKYAWLVGAAPAKGMDGKPQVKIFTEDGEMKVFALADDFTLDTIPTAEISVSTTPALYSDGAIAGQLVTFTANGEEIKTMETREIVASKITGHEKYNSALYYLTAPYNCFGFKYLVRENTKLFVVPETYTKDEDYKTVDALSIQQRAFLPNLCIYDIDEYCVTGAMVAVGASSNTYERPGVVMGVGQALDAEGEPANTINIVSYDGEKTILLAEDVTFRFNEDTLTTETTDGVTFTADMLKKGDMIWYSDPNEQGRVGAIHVAFRAQTPLDASSCYSDATLTGTAKRDTDMYQADCFAFGEITAIKDGAAVLKTQLKTLYNRTTREYEFEDHLVPLSLTGCLSFYAFDSAKGEIKAISEKEIYAGDMLLSYRQNLSQAMIIVYR